MFCVKYVMAEKASLPTLILDEIDNGVSGEIAIQLGAMMKSMAKQHQIIAISHLPQIAAKGDTHYFVYKDNTTAKTITHIRQLDETERVAEIAKMIGGARPSSVAMENARELMENWKSSKKALNKPRNNFLLLSNLEFVKINLLFCISIPLDMVGIIDY